MRKLIKLFTFHWLHLVVDCLQIRISTVDYVRAQEPVWLNCTCDLPKDQIYSIKWFKDKSREEFWRYIPGEEPDSTRFYNTTGVMADVSPLIKEGTWLPRKGIYPT